MMNTKPVVGFEGIYEVSDCGRVFRVKTGKELSPANVHGYLQVKLCNKSSSKIARIHRIVAMAFIENKDNLPWINHKDRNRANNHVSNLEWCNASHNILHASCLSLENSTPIAQARKRNKLSQGDLAALVGCSRTFMSMMECGRRKPGPRMANRLARVLGIDVTEVRDWAQEGQVDRTN